MADLQAVVQKMIDAGESEENIATVIKSAKTAPPGDTYTGPDTFVSGAVHSLKETATGTGKGILRGLTSIVDPRTYLSAGRNKAAAEQRMTDELAGTKEPTHDYGMGRLRAIGQSLSTPEGGGEAIGQLASGLLVPRIVPAGGQGIAALGKKSYNATLKPLRSVTERNPNIDLTDVGLRHNLPLRESSINRINTEVQVHEAANDALLANNQMPIQLRRAADTTVGNLTGPGGAFRDRLPDRQAVSDEMSNLTSAHPDFSSTPSRPSGSAPTPEELAHIRANDAANAVTDPPLRDASAAEAQALKQRLYGRVRNASWGEMASPQQETIKGFARNINDQLKTAEPAIVPHLKTQSELLAFQDALSKALPRLRNNNLLPLESSIYLAANPTAKGALAALSRTSAVGDIGGRALYRSGTALQQISPETVRRVLIAAMAGKQ